MVPPGERSRSGLAISFGIGFALIIENNPMRLAIISFLSIFSLALGEPRPKSVAPVEQMRNLQQDAFKVGEELSYIIRYGFVEAGKAEISVQAETRRAQRPVYHVVGTGRSIGMAEWFFKTRDRYESFIDQEALVPWEFIRDVNEGGHKINRHLIFDQYEQTVRDLEAPEKGSFQFESYAQDMLSAFYYARSIDASELKPGDVISFTMFLDHEQFPFRLIYLGREMVKTKLGTIECLKLRPSLQKGRVFKDEEDMTIYVSADKNKIPVLIQTDLLVGSIKVELLKHKNLRYPLKVRS